MNSTSQKYHGEWWVPAELNPDNHCLLPAQFKGREKRYTGTLTYHEKEDATLELYHVPSNFHASLYKYNSVIWGMDADGNIFSLFNLVMGKQHLGEFTNTTYTVGCILKGEHIKSIEDACFSRCIVQFPYLRNWAFQNNLDLDNVNGDFCYTLKNINKSNYLIEQKIEDGVKWILRNSYTQSLDRFSITITQDTEFVIDTPHGMSIYQYLKQITEFSQFLSIALYCEQSPSSIQFVNKSNNNQSTLLFTIDESVEPRVSLLIKFKELKTKIPSMLSAWHQNFKDIAPISKYLVDSLRKNKTFDIPDFLIIAQALDGYHKRFINKKDGKDIRKYEDQIGILLKQFEDVEVILKCSLDPKVITDTRHKYSHLYPDDEKSKAMEDGEELFWLTEKCKILLTCCIMNLMGLTNEEINICCKQSPIEDIIEAHSFEF